MQSKEYTILRSVLTLDCRNLFGHLMQHKNTTSSTLKSLYLVLHANIQRVQGKKNLVEWVNKTASQSDYRFSIKVVAIIRSVSLWVLLAQEIPSTLILISFIEYWTLFHLFCLFKVVLVELLALTEFIANKNDWLPFY